MLLIIYYQIGTFVATLFILHTNNKRLIQISGVKLMINYLNAIFITNHKFSYVQEFLVDLLTYTLVQPIH